MKTSVCFFIHTVQKFDSKETEERELKVFYNAVEDHPNEWREFYNEKNGKHLIYNKKNIVDVNNTKNRNVIDLDVFIKVIHFFRNNNKLKRKKSYAYILKGIQEGLFGIGIEKMEPIVFCDFMFKKGFLVGKKSNIYKYLPSGNYPNWTVKGAKNPIIESNLAVSFINELINKYNELKKHSLENALAEDT